jgi:hypothetical protein
MSTLSKHAMERFGDEAEMDGMKKEWPAMLSGLDKRTTTISAQGLIRSELRRLHAMLGDQSKERNGLRLRLHKRLPP